MSHDEEMKGKKLFIMFKFYHAVKKGGGCYLNQVHFGSGLGSGTRPIGMVICPLLDTCHYLTGSSVLNAMDLKSIQLLLPVLFLLF